MAREQPPVEERGTGRRTFGHSLCGECVACPSSVPRGPFGVHQQIFNEPSPMLNNRAVLNPRLLLVHRTVVTEGTLIAAAAALGYTVSAVSQQLSQLEREAGSPL